MRRDPTRYDRAVSRERFLRLVLAPTLLFFAFAGTPHCARPAPPRRSPAHLRSGGKIKLGDAYNGETIFSTTCAGCHGQGGKGGGTDPRAGGRRHPAHRREGPDRQRRRLDAGGPRPGQAGRRRALVRRDHPRQPVTNRPLGGLSSKENIPHTPWPRWPSRRAPRRPRPPGEEHAHGGQVPLRHGPLRRQGTCSVRLHARQSAASRASCYGACARAWPVYFKPATLKAGKGVKQKRSAPSSATAGCRSRTTAGRSTRRGHEPRRDQLPERERVRRPLARRLADVARALAGLGEIWTVPPERAARPVADVLGRARIPCARVLRPWPRTTRRCRLTRNIPPGPANSAAMTAERAWRAHYQQARLDRRFQHQASEKRGTGRGRCRAVSPDPEGFSRRADATSRSDASDQAPTSSARRGERYVSCARSWTTFRLPERPVRRHPQVGERADRRDAAALEGRPLDSIAMRREDLRRSRSSALRTPAKSSLLQALSNIQIETADHVTTTRPVPAAPRIRGMLVQLVEIPACRRSRGPWRRASPARRLRGADVSSSARFRRAGRSRSRIRG